MKKILMDASQISDFQVGVDRVIRRGNRCFIAQREGATAQYAGMEVRSDVITDTIRANFAKLTPEQREKMHDAVFHSPYLSMEGRNERLALLDSGKTSSFPCTPSAVRP
jgi:hypothetical protein